MKFSVIIPFLNSATTLERCLQSVVEQKHENVEVILIDNGSTDNSLEIINNFKDKLNIKYCLSKRGGIGKSRNVGVRLSTGEYILFLDSDDYFSLGLFDLLQRRIKMDLKRVDIIRFNANRIEYMDATPRELNKYMLKEMPPCQPKDAIKIFQENECEFGPLWLYCYKTSFFKGNKFKFLDYYIHEDLLNDYILCCANKIANIDFVGYNYVKNASGVTSKKSLLGEKKRAKAILKNYDYVAKLLFNYLKNDLNFLKLRMVIFNEMLIYNRKYFEGKLLEKYTDKVQKRFAKYRKFVQRMEIMTNE